MTTVPTTAATTMPSAAPATDSTPGRTAEPAAGAAADPLAALNRIFVCALIALGDAGQTEEACQLAAAGWSALRRTRPREAERLNGVLHSLTRAKHPRGAASPRES